MPTRRPGSVERDDLELMKFRALGRDQLLRMRELSSYLRSANIGFSGVRDHHAVLRANLAHFGSNTFAHVALPPSSVEWPRDEYSARRVVVIAAESPGLVVHSAAPVIAWEQRWFVVPPGTAPVVFEATSDTELVFASMDDDGWGEGARIDFEQPAEHPPHESAVKPLTSFVKSLCAITNEDVDGAGSPLEAVAREVARSLVATVVGRAPEDPDTYNAAMRIILRDFASAEFTSAALAKRLGVSVRTMQAAFQAQGTTFSDVLRRTRLNAANEMRGRNPRLALSVVAQLTGFGTRQSLHRAMRDAQSRGAGEGPGDRAAEHDAPGQDGAPAQE